MGNQETKTDGWSEVPALLGNLYCIVARLEALFPGRKFTPDGHLVGSIGEAMAAHMFDLHLLSAAEPQHDATTANDQTRVQIKLTQGKRASPSGRNRNTYWFCDWLPISPSRWSTTDQAKCPGQRQAAYRAMVNELSHCRSSAP